MTSSRYVLMVTVMMAGMLLSSGVSAYECLTHEQEDALIAMAIANNQSPAIFIDIFNSMCLRSPTTTEIDDKFDEFHANQTTYVDNQLTNYTDWVEEQLDVRSYLEDMVIIMNTSRNMQDIEERIDAGYLTLTGQLDDQISNFKSEYATQNYVDNQIRMYKQENPEPAYAGWELPLFGIAALVVGVWYLKDKQKGVMPKGTGRRLPFRNPIKAHHMATPGATSMKPGLSDLQALKGAVVPNEEERMDTVDKGVRRGKGKDTPKV